MPDLKNSASPTEAPFSKENPHKSAKSHQLPIHIEPYYPTTPPSNQAKPHHKKHQNQSQPKKTHS
jgi:hypothetical protein